MKKEDVLNNIRKYIITEDINIKDKEGHDLVFLSMETGEEDIALQLLENKYFDRTHLNERENKTKNKRKEEETLLATACYYACPKVVKVLLEDEDFLKQVGKGLNPYQALIEPFYEIETRKKNSRTVAKPYTREEVEFIKELEKTLEARFSIFNELLKHEDIFFGMMEFIKIHDITRKKFTEWKSTRLISFPYDTGKIKSFVTKILKEVIKTRKKSDWMSLDNWGEYTLPKYMIDTDSLDLFYDMMKREDFDINQTKEPSKLEYRRTLATHAINYFIDNRNGRIFPSINEIYPKNLNILYSIVLDERFSPRLTLDIIHRLEYSNIKDKGEIIKKIITTKQWPREEIYDETALACAFYQDIDNFTYLLNHPNVELKTTTLEIIARYIEYYPSDSKDEKTEKIKKLVQEKLQERPDRWSRKDKIAYALLFEKTNYLCTIDNSLESKIASHFEEQEEVRKEIEGKNFILPQESRIYSNVPEYIINRLMYIINPKEQEQKRISACYEKVEELMTNYHFIDNPEELFPYHIIQLQEQPIIKKKTIFGNVEDLWKKRGKK